MLKQDSRAKYLIGILLEMSLMFTLVIDLITNSLY